MIGPISTEALAWITLPLLIMAVTYFLAWLVLRPRFTPPKLLQPIAECDLVKARSKPRDGSTITNVAYFLHD